MISGKTQLIAHLGYPTKSFRAPMIYNPFFEQRGIDAVVVPMGCRAENYAEFFKTLFTLSNIHGALITMPHKVTTMDFLDDVSTTAKVAGACNAVRLGANGQLVGDQFDGEGFVRGVIGKGKTLRGSRVLVVGAGGVGSAISASLAKAGVAAMTVFDHHASLANTLAARLKQHYPELVINTGSNDPKGFDVVVNATPLGMNEGDSMPMDVSRIEAETFVGEVVMAQEITPFLAAVRERGCAYQVGTDMLFEQIPAYLEFFGFESATADELRAIAKVQY